MELTLKLRSGDIDSFIRSSINVNFLDSRKSSLLYIIETADVQAKLPSKESLVSNMHRVVSSIRRIRQCS